MITFILDLFKYNDNSKNRFSDAFFRASLVEAISETVTPVTAVTTSHSEALSPEMRNILDEIVRYFNMDKLLPSYKFVVTIACLKAIRHLQKMGHLPSNSTIFRCHTSVYCFVDVRKAAIEILVGIVKAEVNKEDFDFLIKLIVQDPCPTIKYHTMKMLIKNPPFDWRSEEVSKLDTEDLVETLWQLMNSTFRFDSKLRCAAVDLYYVLYGRERPRCLPMPELSFVLNLDKNKASGEIKMEEETSNVQDEPPATLKDGNSLVSPRKSSLDDRSTSTSPTKRSLTSDSVSVDIPMSPASMTMPSPKLSVPPVVPTIRIKAPSGGVDSPLATVAPDQSSSSPSSSRKRKEEGDDQSEPSSSKHHKDKKKKKKKHKNKHKKHKHHSADEKLGDE